MHSTWRSRLGYLLAREAFAKVRRHTHWSETGAVPLLGVRGGFFIGHGRSTARAVCNAVRPAIINIYTSGRKVRDRDHSYGPRVPTPDRWTVFELR